MFCVHVWVLAYVKIYFIYVFRSSDHGPWKWCSWWWHHKTYGLAWILYLLHLNVFFFCLFWTDFCFSRRKKKQTLTENYDLWPFIINNITLLISLIVIISCLLCKCISFIPSNPSSHAFYIWKTMINPMNNNKNESISPLNLFATLISSTTYTEGLLNKKKKKNCEGVFY